MSEKAVFNPGVIDSETFAQLFEAVEVGTAFHIMGGTTPGGDGPSTIEVSSYNYAHGRDFVKVFGEAHMMHGMYSFDFPRADIVIRAAKNARYAKDNELLDYRAMRVTVDAETPVPASFLAIGGVTISREDYWLVRDSWKYSDSDKKLTVTSDRRSIDGISRVIKRLSSHRRWYNYLH